VRLGLEIERARFAVAPHFDVLRGGRADRYARVRQVRQQEQRAIPLQLDGVELNAQLFDLLRARTVGFLHRRRVEPPALRARDLVARSVLQPFQAFELRDDPAARGFERGDLFERLVGIDAAIAQPCTDNVDVIANERGVEHAAVIVRYDFAVATVRKAVFPVAGLGTRFLPATKAQPKEMLPLVDKPIIQYGVEEAVASGVDNIILVTGRGKNAIEDHFDVSVELESFLEARGKREQLDEVRKISNMINFAYVRQGEPLGLGHAVLVARELVGNEPFAVILGDDVIDADPPAIKQLISVYQQMDGPVIAVERVPRDEISSYGIIAIEPNASLGDGIFQVRDLVEKPPPEDAPSDLAIIGRYVLTPDIFPALAATKSDRTGEIQLTNGLRALVKSRPIYACQVKGVRHDTGNKLGFLKAVVYFALRRPDLADKFSAYLASLDLPAITSRR
jgi:UTP--glucose-1-phosphate uridylyltransferase